MRHHVLAAALLLACGARLEADTTVTIASVSPDRSPGGGGTQVTIRGTGFKDCYPCDPSWPPLVFFGETEARQVRRVDETTLLVNAPPHAEGTVDVSVFVSSWGDNATATLPSSFTYGGSVRLEGYDRILLPLFVPPVLGAYGSEFHTRLSGGRFIGGFASAPVYGLDPSCAADPCDPTDPFTQPFAFGSRLRPEDTRPNGSPGRFIYLPKGESDAIGLNLRAADVSRESSNFGTEIPVVPAGEFRRDHILLAGVPSDPRYRITLRVYATAPVTLTLSVGPETHRAITLRGGRDGFDPAYYEAGDLVLQPGSGQIQIVRESCSLTRTIPCGEDDIAFWAFLSVTNNDTQTITTITPQP